MGVMSMRDKVTLRDLKTVRVVLMSTYSPDKRQRHMAYIELQWRRHEGEAIPYPNHAPLEPPQAPA